MLRSSNGLFVAGLLGVCMTACGPGTQPGAEGGTPDGTTTGAETSVMPDGMEGPDGMTTMPDAMTGPEASAPEGGAPEAGAPEGGAPDAAMPTLNCATRAQRLCDRLLMCTPLVFERTYENMTLCVSAQRQSCMGGTALPEDNGLVDEEACLTALDSCPAYLRSLAQGGMIPPGCVHRRGTRSSTASGAGRACGADFQCVAGEYCYGVTMAPICADGNCGRAEGLMRSGNICNMSTRDPCDVDNDQRCTRQYDMMTMNRVSTETAGSRYTCRQVMRGGSGAPCAPTTEMQCNPNFVCSPTTFTCVSLLGMGEPCDGTSAERCDSRLGLTCQMVPNTMGRSCRPAPFARIGAQCGMVTEGGVTELRQCASAVAFCNSATPTVCEALKSMGEACVNMPRDNCRPPFTCRSGTCQAPVATACR